MHNNAKHSFIIKEKKRLSKKSIIMIVIITIILIIGFWFVYNSRKSTIGNIVNDNTQQDDKDSSNPLTNNEIQKITLSFRNYNYYPTTFTVKQGIPVEITLDNSVGGCYRSFNIEAFGVSQRSSDPSDTIKFTPREKGKFEFRCGMGMGRGTIIVE